MIPKLGVDMTTTEAEAGIADLVRRAGFAFVLRAAVKAAREHAGEKQTEAKRDFEKLNRIADAAGIEGENEDT